MSDSTLTGRLLTLSAVALVGILLLPASLLAQAGVPGVLHLSLGEAVDEALAHAPVLAAADARQHAASFRASSVARARFGQVDGVAALIRYQDDVILRAMSRELFGAQGFAGLPFGRDQAHYGLTFQVPLYLGGRLSAAIDVARLQAEQVTLAVQGTRWEVRSNVTAFYAAVQTAVAVGRALDENLQALAATPRSLAVMVDPGGRPG